MANPPTSWYWDNGWKEALVPASGAQLEPLPGEWDVRRTHAGLQVIARSSVAQVVMDFTMGEVTELTETFLRAAMTPAPLEGEPPILIHREKRA